MRQKLYKCNIVSYYINAVNWSPTLDTVDIFLVLSPTLPDVPNVDTKVFHTADDTDPVVITAEPVVLSTGIPDNTCDAEGIANVPIFAPELYDVPNLTSDTAGKPCAMLFLSINILYLVPSRDDDMKFTELETILAYPNHGTLPFAPNVAFSNVVVPLAFTPFIAADAVDATADITLNIPVDWLCPPTNAPAIAEPLINICPVVLL